MPLMSIVIYILSSLDKVYTKPKMSHAPTPLSIETSLLYNLWFSFLPQAQLNAEVTIF
jgi:hypothetical protein